MTPGRSQLNQSEIRKLIVRDGYEATAKDIKEFLFLRWRNIPNIMLSQHNDGGADWYDADPPTTQHQANRAVADAYIDYWYG